MKPGSSLIFQIWVMFLMLSGCATSPQQLTEENKNAIKNIAIVSLVPESVNFDKIGMISYSNRYTEFDMGNKVTDSILFISQGRIAKSQPGWTLKKITYDRTALLAKLGPGYSFRSSRVTGVFAALARDNNLDAILVVRASADEANYSRKKFEAIDLREGVSVLLKDNNLKGDAQLVTYANLSVTIFGKEGQAMAVGEIPAKLDYVEMREPNDFDVSLDMKHNQRPEIIEKLGREVLVDLSKRLNLCFDALGFVDTSGRVNPHIEIIPSTDSAIEGSKRLPLQAAPDANAFEQCFSRCRQYTDRSKEQCFDACNK